MIEGKKGVPRRFIASVNKQASQTVRVVVVTFIVVTSATCHFLQLPHMFFRQLSKIQHYFANKGKTRRSNHAQNAEVICWLIKVKGSEV